MNLYASLLPLKSQATMLLLTLGAHGRRVWTCSTHGFPGLCSVHVSASCVPLLFLPRAHHSSLNSLTCGVSLGSVQTLSQTRGSGAKSKTDTFDIAHEATTGELGARRPHGLRAE